MKKLFSILIFLGNFLYANINTIVSIIPEKSFLREIGGDKVNITVMVKPGASPHTYEPKASQMKSISKADIYFSIGVEFEKIWLKKFYNQNRKMKIVDLTKGVRKFPISKNLKGANSLDPHIWLNPENVKIIAKNIYQALIEEDKENRDYYYKNYQKFLKKISLTDKKIREILKNVKKSSKFMVFHPAWGYFARAYNLQQIAIEQEGKNPKPKQVANLIKEAKREKVKAIFTAPEFSDKIAKQIAKEVGVPVIKVSPLNPNWSKNLENLAKAIANKK